MMVDSVAALADRLMSVEWDGDWTRTRSRVALLKEYLRRSAEWVDRLGSSAWPFSDIAALVDPQVRADPTIVSQVEASMNRPEVWPEVRDTAVRALHFAALQKAGGALPDLPDPFEPLIIMYERGGGFSITETGAIQIDVAGVQFGSMKAHLGLEPRAPMDERSLDALDRT